MRTVPIEGVEFGRVSAELLEGQQQRDIDVSASFFIDPDGYPGWTLFSQEVITLDGRRIYYPQQAGDYVIRGTGIPAVDGKTNSQLRAECGLAFAGSIMPPDAADDPRVHGAKVGSAVQPFSHPLTSPCIR
jgi:hypothetical protein